MQGKVVRVHTWPKGLFPLGLGEGALGEAASGRGWLAALPDFLSFPPRGSWQGTDLPRAVGSTMQVKPETIPGNPPPALGMRLGDRRAQRGR